MEVASVSDEPTPVSERLAHVRRGGIRLFASPSDEPRSRRISDVVSLTACVLSLILLGIIAEPPSQFESKLLDVAAATPGFLTVVWNASSNLLAIWVLVIIGVALVRRRLRIARDTA